MAVSGQITKATGTAEREAAVDMLDDIAGDKRVTVGTDKAYDTGFRRANARDQCHAARNPEHQRPEQRD
jgi:hypothetical protein